MLLKDPVNYVAICNKILKEEGKKTKYFINLKSIAKFVVDLDKNVSPSDIDEGRRVAVSIDRY